MQSFFKKLPRYSLRLLLAYLVYIFTGGVLKDQCQIEGF